MGGEEFMLISDRIFERLNEISMSQKEFALKTGILQSTISEWKKKKTNPSSDKIMTICSVLNVSPGWLLSGAESSRNKSRYKDYIIVDNKSEIGMLVEKYNGLSKSDRERVMGYMDAFASINNSSL